MAIPSGGLSDTLAQVAVKRVLKKTLLDKFVTLSNFDLPTPVDFPLTEFSSSKAPLAYRSAIALQQAAASSVDIETLAQKWGEVLTSQVNTLPIAQTSDRSLTTAHWHAEVESQGWLIITLTDLGITTWLQVWNNLVWHNSILPFTVPLEQERLQLPAKLTRLPLCGQLRLSLPMLLQFAHACCGHWLQQVKTLQQADSWPSYETEREHTSSNPIWEWSSQSPIACHTLLQRVVRAIDMMAAQAGDPTTCLRQGYIIAEAVYNFQATIPLATVHTWPPESQVSVWSTVRAAQQGLALVLGGILKQTPTQNF